MKIRAFDSNLTIKEVLEEHYRVRLREELEKLSADDAKRLKYLLTRFLKSELRVLERLVGHRRVGDNLDETCRYFVDDRKEECVPGTSRPVKATTILRQLNVLIAAIRRYYRIHGLSIDDINLDELVGIGIGIADRRKYVNAQSSSRLDSQVRAVRAHVHVLAQELQQLASSLAEMETAA